VEGLARRISNFWGGLFDALVRDNKVLPPVVALLALLLFAWVAAGAFMSGPDEEGASGEAELVQSRDPSGADAPEVEDRDADSYAAYRNKDPFRQLLAPADSTPGDAPSSGDTSQDDPTGETNQGGTTTPQDETTTGNTGGNTGGSGGTTGDDETGGDGTAGDDGTDGGGQRSKNDSDGDGLTNRQEERLGQDPRDADTDDDGTEDGADDSDDDGVPDGQGGNGGGGGSGTGTGGGAGGSGGTGAGTGGGGAGGGAGGANGSDDELFDSGGSLRPR